MFNNKGFAVTATLYTILVAFLLFLGATLAMFSSSNSIIGKANDDLINGTTFKAVQVKEVNGTICKWNIDTMVKINSRYGTMYWPKDFPGENVSVTVGSENILGGSKSINDKITVTASTESNDKLTFTQDEDDDISADVTIANICE